MTRFRMGLVGDALAIADLHTHRVTVLNSTAAVVWLTLAGSACSAQELADLISNAPSCSPSPSAASVAEVLQQFETMGWAFKGEGGLWRAKSDPDAGGASRIHWAHETAKITLARSWRRHVRIADAPLKLSVLMEAGVERRDEFARLAGFLGGLPHEECDASHPEISIVLRDGRVDVANDGRIASFMDMETASGVFLKLAIQHAHPDAVAPTTLHAGAVHKRGGAILFPAISGAGKTTLTAYLAANGWGYGGDDVVGVARETNSSTLRLLPFPSALGVKDGSLEILRPHYPHIAHGEAVSYGGKLVRYVACDGEPPSSDGDWRRLRALVFPSFERDAPAELTEVSEPDALHEVLQAGWGDGAEFDATGFDLLIEAVNSLPRYRLKYGALNDAARILEGLV